MSSNQIICEHCHFEVILPNRIITDSCGHKKCRNCLEPDVNSCYECLEQIKDQNNHTIEIQNPNLSINPEDGEEKILKVLRDHIAIKYNDLGHPYYHCTVCKKSFKCRSQQYYHLGCNCKDQRKYKCHQCDKTFSIKSHLNYHIQTHSETFHHCKQCNKQFKNSFVLKKHEKVHGVNSVSCVKCNKIFRSNDSLKIHMLLHSEENFTHSCHICNKTYSTKSNLQQHMLKHFDKKFVCSYCCKRFQRNSSLKSHIKKHEKTESMICAICDKRFSDAGALQRHSKCHEETIKFQCNFCDIITIRKDNMLRHVRNIHPEESFDSCVKILQPHFFLSNKEPTKDICSENNFDELQQHPISCSNLSPQIPENKPKTVENSSVIKCIGNVEPVKVPTIVSKPPDNFSKVNTEKRSINEYDPIKLYRKILTLGDDDEDDNCENGYDNKDDSNPNFHSTKDQAQDNSTLLNCNNFHQTRSSYCWNNFSEMHWRKNFMNTYETDAEK